MVLDQEATEKQPDVIEKTSQMPQTHEEAMTAKSMPEEIRKALVDLVKMSETEADLGRRGHFRQMLEAEEFWKGNQYPVWSENEYNFRTPFDYAVEQGRLEDQPIYQYVLNVFQAYGLSAIAALAQKVPKVRFFPHSAKSEVDIATARAASDIAILIEKNNHLRIMAIREAYLLWTQGGFGTFTRFVREKEKGMEDVPIVESSQVPISDDAYNCQACGYSAPASEVEPMAETAVDPLGQEKTLMNCPQCGKPLSDADFVPGETAEVPVISGYNQVPEGYEKMSVYGLLNLKMSPTVATFQDSGYLQLVEDVHKGALRAAYQSMADQIGSKDKSFQDSGPTSGSDSYERTARMHLFEAQSKFANTRAGAQKDYVTYKRVWLRNWYLMAHPDTDMQKRLFAMFPNGVYVAMADEVFLDARAEDMDDHWTICTAMPGYGIYPQAMGSSTIPLQKQINDSFNIIAEHLDFGSSPPIFYDAEFLSGEAFSKQRMAPGTLIPVPRSRGGQLRSIKELLYQPDIKIDSNIYAYGRSLFELVQVVSGVMPSLFGGQLRGNETLGAYQQSRDQALGKLGLFWTAVKQHHASTMRLAVECFRRNRTGDAEKVILGKSNDFVSKYIRLADLKGSIIAEPEADEDFPQSWAEIRTNLNELLTSPAGSAIGTALFNEPANISLLKKYLGSPEIVFSAEANREKQFRETDELLMAEPVEVPGQLQLDETGQPMNIDPMTGAPPTEFISTVPVDVHADDHMVHIKAIQEWAADPDGGILAKKENPGGYANNMAHLLEHKQALMTVAAFDAQLAAAAGLAPAGAEGEGGKPDANKKSKPPSK